ncbi:MAG TPA: hypothetical protein VK196_08205 [Magnetospirillum sp.]|nr:hypothetical protein [Magnetospirillum sp.]
MRILIPDTWHFHRRNFAAFYDAVAAERIPLWVEKSRRRWWKRHGDYRPLAGQLARHLAALEGLGPEALLREEHRGVRLFAVARSELLCLLLPRWVYGAGPNDEAAIIARAWNTDREDLLLCMAAARDWIDFWDATLARKGPFTHALAFSGSYIYTRALHEVAARAGLRTFAMESFFTGNDFYFEERATPLSNNSALGDPAWMARLTLPDDPGQRARLRAEAQHRLRGMRNKNVRADASQLVPPPFDNRGEGTVLVIGQVLNDFSLIETPLPELSSAEIYRTLIGGILERTNRTVVFKAHPWERRRPNLGGAVTLDLLHRWAATLPPDRQVRLKLVESEPIGGLFPHVDHAVALCSQGLLEAAQAGLKPIQLGRAFFGGHGFTHDVSDVAAAVEGLASGRLGGRLSIDEYRAFEDFLVRALLMHLVANSPEGAAKVAKRLAQPHHVPTVDEARLFQPARQSRVHVVAQALANPVATALLARARWLARRLQR